MHPRPLRGKSPNAGAERFGHPSDELPLPFIARAQIVAGEQPNRDLEPTRPGGGGPHDQRATRPKRDACRSQREARGEPQEVDGEGRSSAGEVDQKAKDATPSQRAHHGKRRAR